MRDLVSAGARQSLLGQPGVHSVGDSLRGGTPVVVVHTDDQARVSSIPETVEGTPTVVEVDEAASEVFRHNDYHRPVEGGNDTTVTAPGGGSPSGTGTLGFAVTDGDSVYATSNNHVWADDVSGRIGYHVTQPSGEEVIGTLTDFVSIGGGPTTVDFAWALMRADVGVDNHIVGVGDYHGEVTDPDVGDPVVYSGRNAGIVSGTVTEVNRTGTVNSSQMEDWTYEDCFSFEPAARPGDSGSPVVLDDGEPYTPVGQVYAAGDTYTIAHKMSNVTAVTGLSVVPSTHEPVPPMYNGRPRADYTYCGSEGDLYSEWVNGRLSTQTFRDESDQGQGTGALTIGQCDGGNGDDGPPTYDGRPRSDYTYCGNQPDLYEQWVTGEITTGEFQSQSAQGQGTTALTLGECTREASVPPALLAGVGLLGAYYWYENYR